MQLQVPDIFGHFFWRRMTDEELILSYGFDFYLQYVFEGGINAYFADLHDFPSNLPKKRQGTKASAVANKPGQGTVQTSQDAPAPGPVTSKQCVQCEEAMMSAIKSMVCVCILLNAQLVRVIPVAV